MSRPTFSPRFQVNKINIKVQYLVHRDIGWHHLPWYGRKQKTTNSSDSRVRGSSGHSPRPGKSFFSTASGGVFAPPLAASGSSSKSKWTCGKSVGTALPEMDTRKVQQEWLMGLSKPNGEVYPESSRNHVPRLWEHKGIMSSTDQKLLGTLVFT